MSTATLSRTEFDMAKAEAFGATVFQTLSSGFTAMLLSVGHQTRLFDTMATLPPSTSQEIADAANLNERYVREWLNGMTSTRFVEYDAFDRTYTLPPEHAASLTRAAGPGNFASIAQYIPLLGAIEGQILESFRNGGGVPYSAVPEFHRVMAEETGIVFDAALIPGVIPLVPGLRERLETGITVADIGCGSGHAVNLLAEAFPNSRFVGIDFSDQALEVARAEAKRRGIINATFEAIDVATLDAVEEFDLITAFDAIHDQADPGRVLANIQRALRPDGTYLMVDMAGSSHVEENVDHPTAPLLYTISLFHCMTVSLAQGGAGLGTLWGEELAQQMLADAGFPAVTVSRVEGDIMNVYYVCTKQDA